MGSKVIKSFPFFRRKVQPTRRLQLRTVLFLRWIAVIGQTLAVIIAGPVLGFQLPLAALFATIATLALVTLLSQRSGRTSLNDRQSTLHFAFDIVQLGMLLYLTGGLTNPFAILILAPVIVAAAILSYRSIMILGSLTIATVILLAFFHGELLWPTAFSFSALYTFGFAIALMLAIIFMVTYVFLVAEEARRLSNALQVANMALEREHRLASLGALAAAAAHELGSPLGTIAIAAKELSRSLPKDHPAKADADLLVRESGRCRDILAELAARPEHASKDHFALMPANALIELAASSYRREKVDLRLSERPIPPDPGPLPLLPRRPEIVHGLENIIHNAMEAAHNLVHVTVEWNRDRVALFIEDDGRGFSPDLLQRIGEPYLTDGPQKDNHMGLGIFIAQHLIAQSGGDIIFANRPEGGAMVQLSWSKEFINDVEPASADR